MLPIRPYLLRAYFDWIVDNGWTPYLLVDAGYPGADVPQEYISEGRIVLNVAPRAVRDFEIAAEAILFSARFAGVSRRVYVPVDAVLALYPHETGEGITFPQARPPQVAPSPEAAPEEVTPPEPPEPLEPPPSIGPKRPALRIVKDNER